MLCAVEIFFFRGSVLFHKLQNIILLSFIKNITQSKQKQTMIILPKPIPALKLALTGATVGPLVDSLHNQCLLEYQKAMIDIPQSAPRPPPFFLLSSSPLSEMMQPSDHMQYLIRTSWYVPPLLGIAYLVLGAILPHVISRLLSARGGTTIIGQQQQQKGIPGTSSIATSTTNVDDVLIPSSPSVTMSSKSKAILAVLTTAIIIKLSEILETSSLFPHFASEINIAILFTAAFAQWYILDCTISSLLTATIVSVGGPLSELPFVANGFWHYLPQASDYYPLQHVPNNWDFLTLLLGDDYKDLALSSITAPCYFAVTMDAIALSRWFSMDDVSLTMNKTEEVGKNI